MIRTGTYVGCLHCSERLSLLNHSTGLQDGFSEDTTGTFFCWPLRKDTVGGHLALGTQKLLLSVGQWSPLSLLSAGSVAGSLPAVLPFCGSSRCGVASSSNSSG